MYASCLSILYIHMSVLGDYNSGCALLTSGVTDDTESQNRRGCEGPLGIIESNPLLKQVPRVGYTGKHPSRSCISPEETPQPLCAACSCALVRYIQGLSARNTVLPQKQRHSVQM